MELWPKLDLEHLSPANLWSELDSQTRSLAVRALYQGAKSDRSGRREADRAVAAAVRFRESAVRQLPLERRVHYLLHAVRPDDSLASSLLLALHLEERVPLLESFLDRLGIPQQGGLIDADHEVAAPEAQRLTEAAATLFECFPEAQVELYLASLLALDPDTWSAMSEVIRQRRG